MILPIYSFGHPILRQKTDEIDANYPDLKALIDNMWETMYNANGVGLAAPQIGLALRLFIIDARPFAADPEISEVEKQIIENFKHVFINPTVIESGSKLIDFNNHQLHLTGLASRVVQHEYDHIEGKLFTDKLSPFKRKILKSKLTQIEKGNIKIDYPMEFAKTMKPNNNGKSR
ncbi:MAG: peptide deformylase [Flavobacteriales bacterium]|nr:peptide deformylase [Flavobacteriales bacterium]